MGACQCEPNDSIHASNAHPFPSQHSSSLLIVSLPQWRYLNSTTRLRQDARRAPPLLRRPVTLQFSIQSPWLRICQAA